MLGMPLLHRVNMSTGAMPNKQQLTHCLPPQRAEQNEGQEDGMMHMTASGTVAQSAAQTATHIYGINEWQVDIGT